MGKVGHFYEMQDMLGHVSEAWELAFIEKVSEMCDLCLTAKST